MNGEVRRVARLSHGRARQARDDEGFTTCRVVLRRVGGMRAVKVRGRSVKEVELKDNDEIQIASELFVFHE